VLNDEGDFIEFDVVIGNPPYFSLSKVKEQSDYFSKANYKTYSKGADIYCLFYELGGNILKPFGFLTYITSNSWLRAIYGELLKKYFINNLQPLALLNIDDVQIFEEATVESNILTLQKSPSTLSFPVSNLSNNYLFGDSLSEYFKKNNFQFTPPATPEWFVGEQSIGLLKNKIESESKLLKDYNIRINFGIKTGYNEAFIIDEKKKDELIALDSKNASIIKPVIRGRDLKKYFYEFEKIYLINTHNGIKSLNIDRVNCEIDFPGIYNHISSFLPKVKMRSDMGKDWTNLKNCAYLEDFEKEKIIWGEISDKAKFAYDDQKYFAEATTFLMTGQNLKFLLAVLNSKVSEWYFNLIGTTTGMGTNRWKKYKIEMLPIKQPSDLQEKEIENLVNEILKTKKSYPNADTLNLENQIDQLVYKLYNLTEEEIKIVEGV